MNEHVLKVAPPYFDALLDGTKTFEVRVNDRGFQKGDRLVLWEFDVNGRVRTCGKYPCDTCKPRAVTAAVGFVFSGEPRIQGMAPGYVAMSLLDVKQVVP